MKKTENNTYKGTVVIKGNQKNRVDAKYAFASSFNLQSGLYIRTGNLKDGKDTGIDPFMASFPHLIDVGIMGHCLHGKSGLCAKAGIGCYQSGAVTTQPNMSFDNFKKIADECSGYVDQFALGGRGDPDCHEQFEKILAYCQEKLIVPNYTTSGFGFNKEKAEISKKYCGAVAVSWYRNEYTQKALDLLSTAGVKTNIHYVLGKNSIDEAIERLSNDTFPEGINAVIFLLHKPVGQGSETNVLQTDDRRLNTFFDLVVQKHAYKIGFDSCSLPAIVNYSNGIVLASTDTCEGARYSMYISSDMIATPCSFDASHNYGYDISNDSIYQAWQSAQFEAFRDKLRSTCPNCSNREYCMGGCPLCKSIVLCPDYQKQNNI